MFMAIAHQLLFSKEIKEAEELGMEITLGDAAGWKPEERESDWVFGDTIWLQNWPPAHVGQQTPNTKWQKPGTIIQDYLVIAIHTH